MAQNIDDNVVNEYSQITIKLTKRPLYGIFDLENLQDDIAKSKENKKIIQNQNLEKDDDDETTFL